VKLESRDRVRLVNAVRRNRKVTQVYEIRKFIERPYHKKKHVFLDLENLWNPTGKKYWEKQHTPLYDLICIGPRNKMIYRKGTKEEMEEELAKLKPDLHKLWEQGFWGFEIRKR